MVVGRLEPSLVEVSRFGGMAAPWPLLGSMLAGLLMALIPEGATYRWLGGGGVRPMVLATLIGIPYLYARVA